MKTNPPEGAEGVLILTDSDVRELKEIANEAKPGDELHISINRYGLLYSLILMQELEQMEPDEPKRLTWRDKESML